jgi:hypothetical protein
MDSKLRKRAPRVGAESKKSVDSSNEERGSLSKTPSSKTRAVQSKVKLLPTKFFVFKCIAALVAGCCTCALVGYGVFYCYFQMPGLFDESSERFQSELERLSSPDMRNMVKESRALASASEDVKILLFCPMFGAGSVNKRYNQLFLESVRNSGVDLILFGDSFPSYSLPPNVKHVLMTWDDLVDRVRDRVLAGKEPNWMRKRPFFYKVVDYKPLVAHLFSEMLTGYHFWGKILDCFESSISILPIADPRFLLVNSTCRTW